MARKPKPSSKPSFFKVLPHDFTHRLKLPPYFILKQGDTFPERCKLRCSYGQTFDVRIEKTNDGKHCFFTGKGWSKFVKDLELEIGEFVVMWFDGKLEFDVSVFKINGCEKETFRCKPEPVEFNEDAENLRSNKQRMENEAEQTEVGAKSNESCPRFEVVLKEWQRSRLTLPKEFAEKASLIGETAAVLKYLPKKKHWAVSLNQRSGWFRLELSTGWRKFCETNGMICGNTYSFTFNQAENVIQVEPINGSSSSESQSAFRF